MSNILYVDNTGYISLSGYKNGLTGDYINDATVTVDILDSDGNSVGGITNPLILSYQASSNGNYSVAVDSDIEITEWNFYKAKVVAISSGVKSTFNCTIQALPRKCS